MGNVVQDRAGQWLASARAPRQVALALALLLVGELVQVARMLVAGLPAVGVPPQGAPTAHSPNATTLVATVMASHLFGIAPLNPQDAQAAAALATARLVGLYVSDEPGASRAWIREANGTVRAVQVGDALSGGRVRAIAVAGVDVVTGDGASIRLAFPVNPFLAMLRGEAAGPIDARAEALIPAELSSSLLRVQPAPDPQGGTRFRVYPGADVLAFQRSGLRAGDELESIAGQPVTSPRAVWPLFEALRAKQALALRIRRRERVLDLTLRAEAAAPVSSPSPTLPPPAGASI